jgi:hypothetical protein
VLFIGLIFSLSLQQTLDKVMAAEFENIDSFDTNPTYRWLANTNNNVTSVFEVENSILEIATTGEELTQNQYSRSLARLDFKTESRFQVPNISQGILVEEYDFSSADQNSYAGLVQNYNWSYSIYGGAAACYPSLNKLRIDSTNTYFFTHTNNSYSDFRAEVDLQLSSINTPLMGLGYDLEPLNNTMSNGYAAVLDYSTQKVILKKYVVSNFGKTVTRTAIAEYSMSLVLGDFYHLTVINADDIHRIYINDSLVIDETDSTYSEGHIGCGNEYDDAQTNYFDNLEIYALNPYSGKYHYHNTFDYDQENSWSALVTNYGFSNYSEIGNTNTWTANPAGDGNIQATVGDGGHHACSLGRDINGNFNFSVHLKVLDESSVTLGGLLWDGLNTNLFSTCYAAYIDPKNNILSIGQVNGDDFDTIYNSSSIDDGLFYNLTLFIDDTNDKVYSYVNDSLIMITSIPGSPVMDGFLAISSHNFTSDFSFHTVYAKGEETEYSISQTDNNLYLGLADESESDITQNHGVLFKKWSYPYSNETMLYYTVIDLVGTRHNYYVTNISEGTYLTLDWKVDIQRAKSDLELEFDNETEVEDSDIGWYDITSKNLEAFTFREPLFSFGHNFTYNCSSNWYLDYIKAAFRENRFDLSGADITANVTEYSPYFFEVDVAGPATNKQQATVLYNISVTNLDYVSIEEQIMTFVDYGTGTEGEIFSNYTLYGVNNSAYLTRLISIEHKADLDHIAGTGDRFSVEVSDDSLTSIYYSDDTTDVSGDGNKNETLGFTISEVDSVLDLKFAHTFQSGNEVKHYSYTIGKYMEFLLSHNYTYYTDADSGIGATGYNLNCSIVSFDYMTHGWFDVIPDVVGGVVDGLASIFAIGFKMLADAIALIMLPIKIVLDIINSSLGAIIAVLGSILAALGVLETLLATIDGVLDGISTILNAVSTTLDTISSILTTISGTLTSSLTELGNVVTELVAMGLDIGTLVSEFANLLADTAAMVTDLAGILSSIGDIYDEIIGDITTFLSDIPDILSALGGLAAGVGAAIWSSFVSAVGDVVDAVLALMGDILDAGIDGLWTLANSLSIQGVALADIISVMDNMIGALAGIASTALDWLTLVFTTFLALATVASLAYILLISAAECEPGPDVVLVWLGKVVRKSFADMTGGTSILGFRIYIPLGIFVFLYTGLTILGIW